ncbi:MAG TPA: hypothetical protein VFN51_03265, partial [Candidatus Saccharimonadales bacterium]|nr:hypothetical protein [Candidatus Saccharimonadales bacterium]
MSKFKYESPDFRDYIREQLARRSQPFTNPGIEAMPNQGFPEIMPTTEPSRTETEPPIDYKPTAVSDRASINQPTELMTQPLEPGRQPLFYDPETDDDITREIPLGTIKVNPYVISDFDNTFSSTEKQKGEKKHSPLLIPVALIGLALTGGGVAVNELILKKIQDGPIVFIKREFTPPAHKQSPTPQQPEKVSAASHHISPSPHKVIHIVKKVKNEASAKATDAVNHP